MIRPGGEGKSAARIIVRAMQLTCEAWHKCGEMSLACG